MHLNIPYCKAWCKREVRNLLILLAYTMIFLAILSSIFRALTPFLGRYQSDFEHHLSQKFGTSVHIQKLEASWYWFEPIIQAQHIVIDDLHSNSQIKVKQLQLGIDLLSSLMHWRIQLGLLSVDGIKLKIKETPTHWAIQGIPVFWKPGQSGSSEPTDLLALLLGNRALQLQNVDLDIDTYLPRPKLIRLRHLNATIANQLGQVRVKGTFNLPESSPNSIEFGAEMVLNVREPFDVSGHVYLGFDQFKLDPWLVAVKRPVSYLQHGVLRARVWGELFHGRLTGVQTQLDLNVPTQTSGLKSIDSSPQLASACPRDPSMSQTDHDVSPYLRNCQQNLVSHLQGHFYWTQLSQGFRLVGEDVKIEDQVGVWPEFSFSFDHNVITQQDGLSVTALDVSRVLSLSMPELAPLLPLKQAHLQGMVHNLQVTHSKDQLQILTQFQDLSWQGKGQWPSVKHASGMLQWGRSSGRMGLDSQNLWIKWPGYPVVRIPTLNMDMSWQKIGEKWSVELRHLAMEHPNLKLNVHGRLDPSVTGSADFANVQGEYEFHSAEYWFAFLPKAYLKPKLYEWLTQDVHHIESVLGTFILKGDLSTFPFDHQEGILQIDSQLEGVNLLFAQGWPQAENISARLLIDKRQLSAQIATASIAQVPVGPVQLKVNNLGSDHERLWAHGLAQLESKLVWPIVLSSPLGQKNDFLKNLQWNGPLALDLQLDVPLYGNAKNLMFGKVQLFNDQLQVVVPSVMAPRLEQVAGVLFFDQNGLLSSQLTSVLWDQAVPISIKASSDPNRVVIFDMKVRPEIKTILQALHQPELAGISGHAVLNAQLSLLSEGNHQLRLWSDLEQVKIDFPPFIEKTVNEKKPFETVVLFLPNGMFTVHSNYADQIQLTHSEVNVWSLQSALPQFQAQLSYDVQQKLVSGEIESFGITEQGLTASDSLSKMTPQDLPQLDVKIKDLRYGTISLGSLSVKSKTQDNTWHINPWVIQSPAYQIQGTADWTKINNRRELTHMSFNFTTRDMNKVLMQWQLNPLLEKGKGSLQAELSWNHALWKASLANMSGQVAMKLFEGRTMTFNKRTESKLGLGKLLSLLSLQTIPRRLKLDFSDLSNEGYSFDEFSGKFKLKEGGLLQTESCTLEGPIAAAEIKGTVDLVHQLYQLSIRIAPHITASLPVVATIAGGAIGGVGAIAGLATWVASKIINRGVQKIVAYTYLVTGPWKDPVIEPIRLYKAGAKVD